jgi:hypothetical protein
MSDSEYNQDVFIELTIGRKMRPIYWIVGGSMFAFLTIFVTIALPIQTKLIEVSNIQQTKASKEEVARDLGTYIRKDMYFRIEEDEHLKMVEAIKTPIMAPYIMKEINNNILKELGFSYTIRGDGKTN